MAEKKEIKKVDSKTSQKKTLKGSKKLGDTKLMITYPPVKP